VRVTVAEGSIFGSGVGAGSGAGDRAQALSSRRRRRENFHIIKYSKNQ